jgi:hypothetical protein
MTLDRRQTEIQVGAGQTESRINREFVEFLRKYTWVITLLIAAIVASVYAVNYVRALRVEKTRLAWSEVWAARQAGNPDALLAAADDHAGEGSVPLLARMDAADILLNAAFTGVRPGAERDPQTGALRNPEADLLSDQQKAEFLDRAGRQYARVMRETERSAGQTLIWASAAFGLASVHESKGEFDQANALFERIAQRAENERLPDLAAEARARIESSPTIREARIPARSELLSGRLIERRIQVDPSRLPQGPGPFPATPANPAPSPAPEQGTVPPGSSGDTATATPTAPPASPPPANP